MEFLHFGILAAFWHFGILVYFGILALENPRREARGTRGTVPRGLGNERQEGPLATLLTIFNFALLYFCVFAAFFHFCIFAFWHLGI